MKFNPAVAGNAMPFAPPLTTLSASSLRHFVSLSPSGSAGNPPLARRPASIFLGLMPHTPDQSLRETTANERFDRAICPQVAFLCSITEYVAFKTNPSQRAVSLLLHLYATARPERSTLWLLSDTSAMTV